LILGQFGLDYKTINNRGIIKMSEVRIYKMISGEEVLARVTDIDDENMEFEKPRAIQVVGVQDGGLQISLIPWVITDPDGTQPVKKSSVMTTPLLTEALEKSYIAETTSIAMA
jgi:hypothetical protein